MIDVVDEQGQQTLDPKLKEIIDSAEKPKEGYVFCAACSHPIAHVDDRIAVEGSHDHVFTNPHDVTYHLGCYAQASGCSIHGPPYAADTWFPGFVWRLAQCGSCRAHLGWSFENVDENFFGLILENLQTD